MTTTTSRSPGSRFDAVSSGAAVDVSVEIPLLAGRLLDCVDRAVQHHAARRCDGSGLRRNQIGVVSRRL
jgi:hypothetical protein